MASSLIAVSEDVEALPGSYVLVLCCSRHATVVVGKLGIVHIEPGYYSYVGSALGPGGVKARIKHHSRITTRPHWHIDYLRPHASVVEVWFTCHKDRREHDWASCMARARGCSIPLAGFGASDCHCRTHLFFSRRKPSFETFTRRLKCESDTGHPAKINTSLVCR